MQYYLIKENKQITKLTATSGDTGRAVAHAFSGLDNVKVIVLFPEKEVSDRQRKQMTTLQKNITAIAIDGKFDDCQAMVKKAFSDEELKSLNLSSANSIKIGRSSPSLCIIFMHIQGFANIRRDHILNTIRQLWEYDGLCTGKDHGSSCKEDNSFCKRER
jgi:threonine synthase